MKTFGDPSKSLQLMDIGLRIEEAAGSHDNNMLANTFYYHRQQKKSIKELCVFILECYQHNPESVVDILGEQLLQKIKTVINN